jgi:hypothetical protein
MDRASWARAAVSSRAWPGLAAVAAGAGAALTPQSALAIGCLPFVSSLSSLFCFPHGPPTPPRTGGAVAQAWALGTLTEAVQDTGKKCDLSHVCDLVVSSQGVAPGTGATIKREFVTKGEYVFPENLPFVLDQVVDYTHPAPNGAGGSCYPSTGTLTVDVTKVDTLVLDFQGQACQLGKKTETQALLFSGAYTGDTASTGKFANAEAIGTFNIEGPSGLPVKGAFDTAKVSFSGQLLLENEPPP